MKNTKYLKCTFLIPAILLAIGLLAIGARTNAQSIVTGAINGTVTDASGAIVEGANVTVVSEATQETRTTVTGPGGTFQFSLLKPGRYSITVEKTGFRKAVQKSEVQLGQTATANAKLEVGEATQTVEITENIPLLQTEDANITSNVDLRTLENIPNPGGDLSYIAQIAPGVTMNTSNGGGFGNFTAFGLPATANLFTINGNDYNDPFLNLNNSGASNLLLGSNEVQEVAVVSNGYTGQYGRQAGAQVDYTTKSGTNKFHGNATYNYNTDAFNANDFFNNASSTPLPKERNNQWAASLGGPIWKDKAFFFVDTEGLRYILGSSTDVVVPTPAFAAAVLNNLSSYGFPNSVPFYTNMFNLWDSAPGISRAVPVDDTFDGSNNLGCGDLNTELGSGGVVPGFEQFGGAGTPNSAYGGSNV